MRECGRPARENTLPRNGGTVRTPATAGEHLTIARGDWGDIFADQVLAAAILDHLLHHSTTVNIRGHSYRLREKRTSGVFNELLESDKDV